MPQIPVDTMAFTAAGLLAFGFGLLACLALVPATRDTATDLIQTLYSATIILALLVLSFMIGPVVLLPAMTLVALRIGYEAAAVYMPDNGVPLLIGLLTATLSCGAMLDDRVALFLLGLWCLAFARRCLLPHTGDTPWMRFLDLLLFPVLPMALLAHGTTDPVITGLMLAAYIAVELFDSFALLCGRLFGRTKAFPELSPNKTIEGLIGGALVMVTIVGVLAFALGKTAAPAALLAAGIGGTAVAGDLAASRLKRRAGIKDFPQVLPRQGGLLDSLDSWVATGGVLSALHLLATTAL